MKNKNIITIELDDGETKECEVLFTVNYKRTGKDYIVFTDHEMDENGNITAYANIYDASGKSYKLEPVTTDDEWNMLQTILTSSQKKAIKLSTENNSNDSDSESDSK